MVCTDRCKYAKGLICKCSCDGENHGTLIKPVDEENEEFQEVEQVEGEIIFRYKDPQRSLIEFVKETKPMNEQLDYLYVMKEICSKCPHSKSYRIGINCTYKSKKQFGVENCPIALKILEEMKI